MKKQVVGTMLVIGTAGAFGLAAAVAPHASAAPADKVFVCKYVGKPGVDERLQTGNNPISVSSNSIRNYRGVGSWFNDAQGRSYVLAVDTGQPKPPVSQCPRVTPPPPPTTTTTVTTKPVTTKPVTTKPVTTKPVTTKPTKHETEPTKHETKPTHRETKPATTKPAPTKTVTVSTVVARGVAAKTGDDGFDPSMAAFGLSAVVVAGFAAARRRR